MDRVLASSPAMAFWYQAFVLASVDDETRQRWIKELRLMGAERHLGKFR
jgi:hypothetical protein